MHSYIWGVVPLAANSTPAGSQKWYPTGSAST